MKPLAPPQLLAFSLLCPLSWRYLWVGAGAGLQMFTPVILSSTMSLGLGSALALMLGMHARMVWHNFTTVETHYFEVSAGLVVTMRAELASQAGTSRFAPWTAQMDPQEWPPDKGGPANARTVFGTAPLLWFVPALSDAERERLISEALAGVVGDSVDPQELA